MGNLGDFKFDTPIEPVHGGGSPTKKGSKEDVVFDAESKLIQKPMENKEAKALTKDILTRAKQVMQ